MRRIMSRIQDANAFGKVAVLYGGDSPERAVSLESGAAVCAALQQRGVDAVLFDPSTTALGELLSLGVTRCWNALHGGAGEDGTIVGALRTLGLPHTGSGVLGSALAMDKIRSKQVLAQNDISVPQTLVVDAKTPLPDIPFPVFVKPSNGGSSIAARPVADASEWLAAYSAAVAAGSDVLVEPLLGGIEYTIAILQGVALPSIRIEVASEFYDYDAKYVSDATRFVCPGIADDVALADRINAMALASFDAIGCTGWGRVDFMLDKHGKPFVLEVNTVPGMTSHSLVPCAAAAAGIDFDTLCWRILETSMQSLSTGGRHGE